MACVLIDTGPVAAGTSVFSSCVEDLASTFLLGGLLLFRVVW